MQFLTRDPMDATATSISAYASSLDYRDLPADTVHEARRRILDSVGCALGAFAAEPCRIAREMAPAVQDGSVARVFGSGRTTTPDMAAFANTAMIRYLDCNDSFVSPGGGHPSDMLPAVLAAAEVAGASGRDVIAALVVAYEIYGQFAARFATREKGWDQGVFIGPASACAAGKVLGLAAPQLAHAMSMTLVSQVPLGQTRVGELSMWKGCATAMAVRNGVFAALLARGGLEGPPEPFEGRSGLFEQVTGELRLDGFGDAHAGVPFKLAETASSTSRCRSTPRPAPPWRWSFGTSSISTTWSASASRPMAWPCGTPPASPRNGTPGPARPPTTASRTWSRSR